MHALSAAIRALRKSTAAVTNLFITTAAAPIEGCSDPTLRTRISAQVMSIDSSSSVVILWGTETDSASARERYIVFDHSQLPDGGCDWHALQQIRTAVAAILPTE
jgi:hypothetical protein